MEFDYYKISRLSHLINKLYENKYRLRDLNGKSRSGLFDGALINNLASDNEIILKEIEPLFNEFGDEFGVKMDEVEEIRGNLNELLREIDVHKSYTGDDVRRMLNKLDIDEIPF